MKTDFEKLIPSGVLFSLKDVENMGIIKVNMAKKLIAKRMIEYVKIGSKLHISRGELLRYLEENTKARMCTI
ncbi:MAG: DNA-binding protein [Thiovulaceae bacterium]|nr:DNA-binding protein [Sulfurimonadaceae bacterium]